MNMGGGGGGDPNHPIMIMCTTMKLTCNVFFQSLHQFPVQLQVLQWYELVIISVCVCVCVCTCMCVCTV